jgi:general secretion pathway protein K
MSAVRPSRSRDRRGVAMIAAIWLVVAISVVTLALSLQGKERRVLGLDAAERTVARAAALGALAEVQAELDYALRVMPQNNAALSSVRSGDPWLGADSVYSGPMDVDSVEVDARLLDLGRCLDVDDLTEDQLRTFFSYILDDYTTADHLAQTIMDWEDPDDLPRPNGDERDGYLKKGLLALPANAPLRTVDELLDVEGMTPTIYAQVAPYLTVYGSGVVNINTAPVPVLRAIPGMTDQILANIISQRSRGLRISSIAQVVPGYAAGGGRRFNAGLAAMASLQQVQLARAMTVDTREILVTLVARASPEAEPTDVIALITRSGTSAVLSWEEWP